jgi:hypothetical protein
VSAPIGFFVVRRDRRALLWFLQYRNRMMVNGLHSFTCNAALCLLLDDLGGLGGVW